MIGLPLDTLETITARRANTKLFFLLKDTLYILYLMLCKAHLVTGS